MYVLMSYMPSSWNWLGRRGKHIRLTFLTLELYCWHFSGFLKKEVFPSTAELISIQEQTHLGFNSSFGSYSNTSTIWTLFPQKGLRVTKMLLTVPGDESQVPPVPLRLRNPVVKWGEGWRSTFNNMFPKFPTGARNKSSLSCSLGRIKQMTLRHTCHWRKMNNNKKHDQAWRCTKCYMKEKAKFPHRQEQVKRLCNPQAVK